MPSVTAAEVKEFLPIDYDVQDGTISILIAGVDDFLERALGRKIASAAEYIDHLDGGGFALWPVNRPVASVTSVTNLSTEDIENSDNYVLSDDRIHRVDGLDWADYYPGCWRVTYSGGEVAPSGLKMAALQLIARQFDNHGGKITQSAAGYGMTWEKLMSSDIWVLLGPLGRGAQQIG
ncbi:hypothetical protein LCGC14_2157500 [marine sediment metagenome]|uniref:Phage gp6-like head-tail connector protein n=1 Tax=marine sediment metagenome TaxID=412755 RepID=A0A0F9DTL1_9ZZZZ